MAKIKEILVYNPKTKREEWKFTERKKISVKDQNNELTQERLKEILKYIKKTGIFTWKVSRGTKKAGSEAGVLHPQGYRQIGLCGNIYTARKLAFLYVFGYLPECPVSTKNGVPDDNRFANLRLGRQNGVKKNEINTRIFKREFKV